MNIDPFITTLLDLAKAMNRPGFKLILGGGFGLYLKQIHRQNQTGLRTLIPGELWPQPRATADLDVFLPTEIVIDLSQMQALRAALDAIGFQPVEEAKFLHFSKSWSAGEVKIDMLTGPIVDDEDLRKVQISRPRVRPRGDLELHAYLTDEAIDFEEFLRPLEIAGTDSAGQSGKVTIYIPQPFTFLLMKLHAFADRREEPNRDLGRHHALDVYRIVAMLTPEEYDQIRENVKQHAASSAVHRAREIVRSFFGSPTAVGIIRLREHRDFAGTMDVASLTRALADLFQH